MAGAAAEAGAVEKAPAILKSGWPETGLLNPITELRWSSRGTHPCAEPAAKAPVFRLSYGQHDDSRGLRSRTRITQFRMNKFERQSPQPADQQTLPDAVAGDLSSLSTEVIDISDAPPIAPPAPLTPSEVHTLSLIHI